MTITTSGTAAKARRGLALASAALMVLGLAACNSAGGASSGSDTLKVGFANMTTGAVSFPLSPEGARVAQEYINEELGGINGRQLELVDCDLENTAQAAQACGQEFAADPEIPFALVTVNVFGNAGFSAALASQKKPVLGAVGITPADLADPNSFWAYSGNPAVYHSWGNLVSAVNDAEGIDHLSVIGQDGSQASANGYKLILEAMDPNIESVNALAQANAADFLSAIRAAKVTNNSMLMVDVPSTAACSGIARDLAKLGIKPKMVATSSVCLTPELVKGDPAIFEGWSAQSGLENPYPDAVDSSEDVKVFTEAWEKYAGDGDINSGGARTGWAVVMTMQRILEESGVDAITPETFQKAIMDYKGPVALGGGGTLNCPGEAPNTAMCNDTVVFYEVRDGAFALDDPFKRLAG